MKLVIVYGFEFSDSIPFHNNRNICKSIVTGNPIFYSLILSNEIDIHEIIHSIHHLNRTEGEKISENNKKYIRLMDYVSHKECNLCKRIDPPRWQIAIKEPIFVRGKYNYTKLYRDISPVRFFLLDPDEMEKKDEDEDNKEDNKVFYIFDIPLENEYNPSGF